MFELFDSTTLIILISLGATGLFMLGVPVFLVIGFWAIGCGFVIDQSITNVGQSAIDAFSKGNALLAMPLFILTGDLIAQSGIAKRLSNFAYAAMGWVRGGLGMATIAACGLFAAISGSNSATTATIGRMLHPELVKGGYDERFSAATSAAGGTVGIIIPPSIIFIVYGVLLTLPIQFLFIAGLIPGLLMVLAMQIACFLVARHNGWGHLFAFNIVRVLKTGLGAWLGFLTIGFVLTGIYSGWFGPTEAAGVTVGFCIMVGFISLPFSRVYGDKREDEDALNRGVGQMVMVKGFSPLEIPRITFRSAQITGVLVPLIAISILMQQILSDMGATDAIGTFVTSFGDYIADWVERFWFTAEDPKARREFVLYFTVLIISMLVVYITGMVLESLPVTIILAPILAPIAFSVGIDPIHFAVVFLVGASIGFITPPYGLNLYVASGVTGVPYFRLLKYTIPYLAALLFIWFVIAFVPTLSKVLTHCEEPKYDETGELIVEYDEEGNEIKIDTSNCFNPDTYNI